MISTALKEHDQYLSLKTGMEAAHLRIGYIAEIRKGELPYSDFGLPVEFFSFDKTKIPAYLESRLRNAGITAACTVTSEGRTTVIDTDVTLWEGTL